MAQRPVAQRRGNRVYEYIRVSTAREEMISPELQHENNVVAAEREGLEIIGTVYDLDMSGRDFAKRKIAEMIQGVRDKSADGILTWKFSRWGRNFTDSLINLRELRQAEGFIVSSTEPGGIETPQGKIPMYLLLLMAEIQSDQIGESWRDTHWNRIRNGLPANGRPRFGYKYDKPNRRFEQDPITAPWLARAYRQYINRQPLSTIVQEMTAAGIRGTGGKPFVHTSMLFVLDSGFGAGKIIVNARRGRASVGDPIYYDGAHEPVITEDEWERYLALRGKRRAPRHVNPVSRFSGLMRCGTCGRTLARYLDEDSRAWGCRNTDYNSTNPCQARASIREHKVNTEVFAWLMDQAQGDGYDEAAARLAMVQEARADLSQLQQEAAELDQALIRLEDRVLRGRLDEDRADVLRAEYETELAENRRNQEELSGRAELPPVPTPEMFDALVDLWNRADVDTSIVNAALSKVIRCVKVYPQGSATRMRVIPAWESDGDSRQADA